MEHIAHTSVSFACAHCPQRFISITGLLIHDCPGRVVAVEPEPAASTKPELAAEIVRQKVSRYRKSRSKRVLPIGELELAPTETAPDGGGNAQSAGVRPSTPFARAVDHYSVKRESTANRAGDTWKRETPPRPVKYCACGMALPMRLPERCGECGRPTENQR